MSHITYGTEGRVRPKIKIIFFDQLGIGFVQAIGTGIGIKNTSLILYFGIT